MGKINKRPQVISDLVEIATYRVIDGMRNIEAILQDYLDVNDS